MPANIYYQVLKHHADAILRLYGVRWVPQPHHYKLCKQLFESEVEGFEPYAVEDVIERLEAYYKEDWWKTIRHDFGNFYKHFDKFIVLKDSRTPGHQSEWSPIASEIPKVVKRESNLLIHCSSCGTNHATHESCRLRKAE